MTAADNPLQRFLEPQGAMVLDGGLATTLEAQGYSFDDALWSARLLLQEPTAIGHVHREFLEAGADCITTASYQATLQGFQQAGIAEPEARSLLKLSVDLALQARDDFWAQPQASGRLRPLVVASIGPYGAYLANGAEYHGDYDRTSAQLMQFHAPRWQLLAESGADLLACETVPSSQELQVLLALLQQTPGVWAWMSVTCKDGQHLRDGSELADVMAACNEEQRIAAVGINCTEPRYVAQCIAEARRVTDKPLLVYPNSGEQFDALHRTWVSSSHCVEWESAVTEWYRAGVQGIGGCCRVGPQAIATIRSQLGKLAGF